MGVIIKTKKETLPACLPAGSSKSYEPFDFIFPKNIYKKEEKIHVPIIR